MKYYLTENGKEVKIGDTITLTNDVETIFGTAKAVTHVVVSQANIDKLLENDVIRRKGKEPLTGTICNKIVADKLGIGEDTTDALLAMLIERGMTVIALQMLLKAASDYLSPGISVVKTLPKVYAFSIIDGRIDEVPTSEIKTYEHFAYFVSKTQAKLVRALFSDLFRVMYDK